MASHCPIITESEGTQSVVQSFEICSDCFGLIVPIPLPDCRATFFSNEKLPMIVGPAFNLIFYQNYDFIFSFSSFKKKNCYDKYFVFIRKLSAVI